MTRADYGENLFREGMNCSQAVLCAFENILDIDRSVLLRISGGFGGGMGRMREVCGAVSGMFMAAGLLYGSDKVGDIQAKTAHYKLVQKLAASFREKNGSIICRELLGLSRPEGTYIPEERTKEYYAKRPCIRYIRCAIEILEEYGEDNSV